MSNPQFASAFGGCRHSPEGGKIEQEDCQTRVIDKYLEALDVR
jgi:hypothetical protein